MAFHSAKNTAPREKTSIKKSHAPIIILVAFVLIFCGWWLSRTINSTDYQEHKFQIIPAENFDLNDLKGYVTYLDFWAAWCMPCRDSFPWMQEMRERFADTKLRIVAINLDQTTEAMQAFLDEHRVNFSIVTDPSYSLFRKHQIQGVPTALLFNEQGEEIWRHPGFQKHNAEQYQQAIEKSLGL